MQKSASKTELLKYFDFNASAPTASALIQQRKKISLEAFDSLFYSFSNAFSLDKTLKGYDPIAVDGSYIYVDEMYGQYVKGAAEVTKAGLTSFIK